MAGNCKDDRDRDLCQNGTQRRYLGAVNDYVEEPCPICRPTAHASAMKNLNIEALTAATKAAQKKKDRT